MNFSLFFTEKVANLPSIEQTGTESVSKKSSCSVTGISITSANP